MVALTLALTSPAHGAQSASLSVALSPERLGAGTTIFFRFRIRSPGNALPTPLRAIDLLYPANVGLVTSGLGLATCTSARLQLAGAEGCPANALMGRGTARVGIAFGPVIVYETGYITIWMAPVQDGHLALLFNAEANTPILADLVLESQDLAAPAPYGGSLVTTIPPLESLPGASDGSIIEMHASIGPRNITYYEHRHGQRVPYQPDGIVLPARCPALGFPFAATFTFQDGSRTTARRRVACPRAAQPRR